MNIRNGLTFLSTMLILSPVQADLVVSWQVTDYSAIVGEGQKNSPKAPLSGGDSSIGAAYGFARYGYLEAKTYGECLTDSQFNGTLGGGEATVVCVDRLSIKPVDQSVTSGYLKGTIKISGLQGCAGIYNSPTGGAAAYSVDILINSQTVFQTRGSVNVPGGNQDRFLDGNSKTIQFDTLLSTPNITTFVDQVFGFADPIDLTIRLYSNSAGRLNAPCTIQAFTDVSIEWIGLEFTTDTGNKIPVNITSTSGTDWAKGIDGSVSWEKTINGAADQTDSPIAAVVDGLNNTILVGETTNASGNLDWLICKQAAIDGAVLWKKVFAGASNKKDVPVAVAVDSAGNIIVTGYTTASNGKTDYTTVKFSGDDGSILWTKSYNGPENSFDEPVGIVLDAEDNAIVTGSSTINGTLDFYTAKYAAEDGSLLWAKSLDGAAQKADRAKAIAVDQDGNVIVTGSSLTTNADYLTVKYSSTGTLLWKRTQPGQTPTEAPIGLAIAATGDIYVVGTLPENAEPFPSLIKYASNGKLLWKRRAGSRAISELGLDAMGNLFLIGTNNSDIYAAKHLSASGGLKWKKSFGGTAGSTEIGKSLAVDANGEVCLLGQSNISGNVNFFTLKLSNSGTLLWKALFDSKLGNDIPRTICIDNTNCPIVFGTSPGKNGKSDIQILKYIP